MKEVPLSSCEKNLVLQAIKEGQVIVGGWNRQKFEISFINWYIIQRIDGRGLAENRDINISFGTEWGCCQVLFGNTR